MRRDRTLLEQFDTTPVSYAVLLAWLTLAVLTDPLDPTLPQLVRFGAASGILVQDGEPWRLLTHAFLHGGLLHLAFNGYFLFWIGPQLEERLGSLRFALLYAVAAAGGGITALLSQDPLQVVVGGSGAIFGMLGGAVALMMRQGRTQLEFLDYHGPRRLLSLIVLNLVLGLMMPLISNAAHVGGLIAGFVLTFLFFDRGRSGADAISRAAQLGWIALFASLTLYCATPVLRWDYRLRMTREATAPEARRRYAEALGPLHTTYLRIEIGKIVKQLYGERGREMASRWLS
ncbi:MAG: rhomboid family intramembrane serine protease [Planctomycetes bacterium]|nr:rhomboid family intramembrane serine protease [Planctomycetota bacterium]